MGIIMNCRSVLVLVVSTLVIIGGSRPRVIRVYKEERIEMASPSWVMKKNGDKRFNTASNWNTGIVPVSGDTVTYDENGQGDCALDMDQSAKTLKIVRKPGYLGTIGGPGNPLQFVGSVAMVSTYDLGADVGDTHIDPSITGLSNVKGDLNSKLFFYGNSGTVFAKGGRIIYTAGCSIPSINNNGAAIEILDGSGTPPPFIVNVSGAISIKRTLITTVNVDMCSGELFYNAGNPDVGGAWAQYGGLIVFQPSAIIVGAGAGINYIGWDGTMDFSQSQYAVDFTLNSLFSADLNVLEAPDFTFDGIDLRKEYP